MRLSAVAGLCKSRREFILLYQAQLDRLKYFDQQAKSAIAMTAATAL